MPLTAGRPPAESAEEKAARAAFRKSLQPQQRATMAIGAIILHWSYLDSEVRHCIELLKTASTDLAGASEPGKTHQGHRESLASLRRLLVRLVGEPSIFIKRFDNLRDSLRPGTELRHDISHNILTTDNPTGEDDDLSLMFYNFESTPQGKGAMHSRHIRDIFKVADEIWNAKWDLTQIVVEAINSRDT